MIESLRSRLDLTGLTKILKFDVLPFVHPKWVGVSYHFRIIDHSPYIPFHMSLYEFIVSDFYSSTSKRFLFKHRVDMIIIILLYWLLIRSLKISRINFWPRNSFPNIFAIIVIKISFYPLYCGRILKVYDLPIVYIWNRFKESPFIILVISLFHSG